MPPNNQNQWSYLKEDRAGLAGANSHLGTWIEAFLVDHKAQNISAGTLYFFRWKLQLVTHFCETRTITRMDQLTPDDPPFNEVTLRVYASCLEEEGVAPCRIGRRLAGVRKLIGKNR